MSLETYMAHVGQLNPIFDNIEALVGPADETVDRIKLTVQLAQGRIAFLLTADNMNSTHKPCLLMINHAIVELLQYIVIHRSVSINSIAELQWFHSKLYRLNDDIQAEYSNDNKNNEADDDPLPAPNAGRY